MSLKNITPEEQLSLNHINNLKAACELGHSDILFTNVHRPVEVLLTVLEETREVKIDFIDEKWDSEKVNLKDYSYLMNTLILS